MKLNDLLKQITPLPYRVQGRFVGSEGRTVADCDISSIKAPACEVAANAIYLAHAANVLPELVEALKASQNTHNNFSILLELAGRQEAVTARVASMNIGKALARAEEVQVNL